MGDSAPHLAIEGAVKALGDGETFYLIFGNEGSSSLISAYPYYRHALS